MNNSIKFDWKTIIVVAVPLITGAGGFVVGKLQNLDIRTASLEARLDAKAKKIDKNKEETEDLKCFRSFQEGMVEGVKQERERIKFDKNVKNNYSNS